MTIEIKTVRYAGADYQVINEDVSVEVIADGLKEALYALPSRWRDGDGERANIVIELTFRQYLELHLASEVSDQDAHPVRSIAGFDIRIVGDIPYETK